MPLSNVLSNLCAWFCFILCAKAAHQKTWIFYLLEGVLHMPSWGAFMSNAGVALQLHWWAAWIFSLPRNGWAWHVCLYLFLFSEQWAVHTLGMAIRQISLEWRGYKLDTHAQNLVSSSQTFCTVFEIKSFHLLTAVFVILFQKDETALFKFWVSLNVENCHKCFTNCCER